MAPPCGTASRARDKPIPFRLRRLGVPQPPPLRSAQWPCGLPGLSGRNLQRVQLANMCYDAAAYIFQIAHARGVIVFIENPTGSYMWLVPSIAELFNLPGVFFTTFHVCMHGGERDKRTSLLHNCEELTALAARCDRSHRHKEWSVSKTLDGRWAYDTSSEAEYPLRLCQKIAAIISRCAVSKGLSISLEPKGPSPVSQPNSAWKIAAGRQPRGKRSPGMLPEDGQVVDLSVSSPADLQLVRSWKGRSAHEVRLADRIFPIGTRIISAVPSQTVGDECGDGQLSVLVGIPMTFHESIRRSLELVHPFDSCQQVPDHVLTAMFHVVTRGSDWIHEERVKRLKWLKRRALELAPKEAEFHKAMEPKVAEVLQGKNLLLLDEVLKYVGYGDTNLVQDVAIGLPITGEGRDTGCFLPEFKPAQLSQDDLWKVAKYSQEEVRSKIPPHMARREVEVGGKRVDVAQEVWASTISEVEKGWLQGPMSADQVGQVVGNLWTPSRRFGILQGSKIRNIDDLSEFSVNQCYGPGEKLDLGGVDEVVAIAAAWMRVLGPPERSEVQVTLSSGAVLSGKKASEFRTSAVGLKGRCMDLKAAYKQLPLRPADRSNAVLGVLDPVSGAVSFFISHVLPFGATGAVMGFNRLARSLREVLQRYFMLPVVNYFDDFPHVDIASLAVKSQVIMESVLKVLGWQVAEEPKKRLPPGDKFVVLGVVIDLTEAQRGVCLVRNKPERASELREVIEEVKSMKSFPPSMAARVYGRLNFAESQCSGRWLAPVLEPIKMRSLMCKSVRKLTKEVEEALELAASMLQAAPPRRLDAWNTEAPCIIFTDGAYEGSTASCGAVVFSPRIGKPMAFGFVVPEAITNQWKSFGHEQVIAQAEMLPIVVIKRQFVNIVGGARVIFFIDNEGVKEAFVSGTTKSAASRMMLVEAMLRDSENNSLSWYARIPSPSNVADPPSRLEWGKLNKILDYQKVEVSLDYEKWGKVRVVPC
eukprot:s1417_g6.t1